MKVHLRLRYEMNRQFRSDSGISLSDYDILVALISDPEGALTMTALATRIGWERSRVSHHARRMEGRGLVGVTTSADDKRASTVSLTESGRTALSAASPGHAEFIRTVFLGALEPSGLTQLAESMELIYEQLLQHGTLPRPEDHP